MKYAFSVLSLWVLSGCTGTGQPDVSFPAYFVPSAQKSFVLDQITLDVTEAKIAFGPAYFCASASGSATLCETALGEILDESVFDALSTERQSVGTYHGFVGQVQSASYDHGLHWFLPQQEVGVSAAAPAGHSALFRGVARRGSMQVPFEMYIDVVPQYRGQRAIPTVSVQGDVTDATESVEMRVDLESWLSTVDYEQMLDSGKNPYVVEKGSVDHDAVVIRMVSNDPVRFVFISP